MVRWTSIAIVLAATLGVSGCQRGDADSGAIELLNVSYDPTRELWRDLNTAFAAKYEKETGRPIRIKQSHGASGSQARAVAEGQDADVVTLALWADTDEIRRKGLIDAGWEERLPNRSLPYYSTIVFVVRKGNPKQIKDWPDLVRPDIQVITPNPKTSGNGRLSLLSAWASVVKKGGDEAAARDYLTKLYRQVPVLDTGARGATTTFAQKNIGDVHLTWENEAHLEVRESKGNLEIVYPSVSVKAEPHVAVVDANVRRKGTAAAADAYLRFAYTDAGQEIIAKNFYRPSDAAVLSRHAATFPAIELPTVPELFGSWDQARDKFFADGAVFDQIYRRP